MNVTEEEMRRVKEIAAEIFRSGCNLLTSLEDLEQEGMLGLLEAKKRWRRAHKKGASLRTFAEYRIRGAIIDYLRRLNKRGRWRWEQLDMTREGEMQTRGPDGVRLGTVSDSDVRIALSKLDPKEREVVDLVMLQGYEIKEAASILGLERAQVATLKRSGLARLKEVLG